MFVFDSSTCINFLRGRMPATLEAMKTMDPAQFALPSIVRAELLLGPAKMNRLDRARIVERFCNAFQTLPFDDACAESYAQIRAHLEAEGTPIGPNDTIIAATALAHNATLVTCNETEFQRIPLLRVECWEEVDF